MSSKRSPRRALSSASGMRLPLNLLCSALAQVWVGGRARTRVCAVCSGSASALVVEQCEGLLPMQLGSDQACSCQTAWPSFLRRRQYPPFPNTGPRPHSRAPEMADSSPSPSAPAPSRMSNFWRRSSSPAPGWGAIVSACCKGRTAGVRPGGPACGRRYAGVWALATGGPGLHSAVGNVEP
jgi:hypothetical protein